MRPVNFDNSATTRLSVWRSMILSSAKLGQRNTRPKERWISITIGRSAFERKMRIFPSLFRVSDIYWVDQWAKKRRAAMAEWLRRLTRKMFWLEYRAIRWVLPRRFESYSQREFFFWWSIYLFVCSLFTFSGACVSRSRGKIRQGTETRLANLKCVTPLHAILGSRTRERSVRCFGKCSIISVIFKSSRWTQDVGFFFV